MEVKEKMKRNLHMKYDFFWLHKQLRLLKIGKMQI